MFWRVRPSEQLPIRSKILLGTALSTLKASTALTNLSCRSRVHSTCITPACCSGTGRSHHPESALQPHAASKTSESYCFRTHLLQACILTARIIKDLRYQQTCQSRLCSSMTGITEMTSSGQAEQQDATAYLLFLALPSVLTWVPLKVLKTFTECRLKVIAGSITVNTDNLHCSSSCSARSRRSHDMPAH